MFVRSLTARLLVAAAVLVAAQDASAQWNPPNPVVVFDQQGNSLDVRLKFGLLRIEVDKPELLHVTYSLAGSSRPP
ncbi:MAG TPA: hypothetical protein VN151_05195, partial [Terracidiphilus sp.]|nr:hypothetical protein [Terracidiphilus sp.]